MDWKKFGNDDDIIKYVLSDKKDNDQNQLKQMIKR